MQIVLNKVTYNTHISLSTWHQSYAKGPRLRHVEVGEVVALGVEA